MNYTLIALALMVAVVCAQHYGNDRHGRRDDGHRGYRNDNSHGYGGNRGGWGGNDGHRRQEYRHQDNRHDNHRGYQRNDRHNGGDNEGGWAHGRLSAGAGAGQGSGYNLGNRGHW